MCLAVVLSGGAALAAPPAKVLLKRSRALARTASRARAGWIRLPGQRALHVRVEEPNGKAAGTVLTFPGLSHHQGVFFQAEGLAPSLVELGYRVIGIDRRGHGQTLKRELERGTPPDAIDLSWATVAAELVEGIEALQASGIDFKLSDAILAAHSQGAMHALAVARANADRGGVGRIHLMNGFLGYLPDFFHRDLEARGNTGFWLGWQRAALAANTRRLEERLPDNVARLIGANTHGERIDGVEPQVQAAVACNSIQGSRDYSAVDVARHVDSPVYLIYGHRDPYLAPAGQQGELWQVVRGGFCHAVNVGGGEHYFPLLAPRQIARWLADPDNAEALQVMSHQLDYSRVAPPALVGW